MLKRPVLVLAVLFVITFLAASEIDYSAIDPLTLPEYLGSLNDPGVEIRYEDSEVYGAVGITAPYLIYEKVT